MTKVGEKKVKIRDFPVGLRQNYYVYHIVIYVKF